MRFLIFIVHVLFVCPCMAMSILDVIHWNPRVVTNVLTNKDFLSEQEIDCLQRLNSQTLVSTAKEVNVECVDALLSCGINNLDTVYSKCAKLSVALFQEQKRYYQECETNEEQAKLEFGVCAVIEGGKCEGGKTVIKHQSTLPATAYDKLKILEIQEHFVCKSGRWEKSQEDVRIEKYPDLFDLKAYFRNGERCITRPMADKGTQDKNGDWEIGYANEQNRFVDCDTEQQKCMYIVEFDRPDTKETDTMIFCCKLHGDFSVSEYDRFHHKMTVDELKKHNVNFYDFCNNTSYDED